MSGNRAEHRGSLEALAERAVGGDAAALNALVVQISGDVYNLAVRMLWCPDDAADASQDILMKVVTRLDSFRGASSLRTWVYRIATNHLLDVRRSRVEQEALTFSRFATLLAAGLTEARAGWDSDPEQSLLVEEVKIGCTTAMLLCLDRDHRVAYILDEVFEVSGRDAAAMLAITPTAFRKRVSRAREKLRNFMSVHCGLANPEAACRCERRVTAGIQTGRVRPGELSFAGHARARLPIATEVRQGVTDMERLQRIAEIFRSQPRYGPPARVLDAIRTALASSRMAKE